MGSCLGGWNWNFGYCIDEWVGRLVVESIGIRKFRCGRLGYWWNDELWNGDWLLLRNGFGKCLVWLYNVSGYWGFVWFFGWWFCGFRVF